VIIHDFHQVISTQSGATIGFAKMKKRSKFAIIFLLFALAPGLAGCQSLFPGSRQMATVSPSPTSTARLTDTPLPTQTSTPVPTSTPTHTPTPTQTPTPVILAEPGTSLPPGLAPISVENADLVSTLAEWRLPTVTDLAWTPDTSILAVSTDTLIELYDVISRVKLRTLYPSTPGLVNIAFSPEPNGKWLVSGSRSGSIQQGFGSAIELWSAPDWQPRGILYGKPQGLTDLSFTPDGKSLAMAYSSTVEQDNIVEFWDTNFWVLVSSLRPGTVLNMAFSPDGKFFGASPDRYSVKVFDMELRQLVYRFLTSFSGAVNSIAFSPSGTMLATGNYEGQIQFLDMTTGTIVREINTESVIESMAFSPDGRILATGHGFQDSVIRLWSVETGELLHTLEGHAQAVNHLLFSPDGQFFVSASYDGQIRMWGIRP
jgi:WD40 repeat protein